MVNIFMQLVSALTGSKTKKARTTKPKDPDDPWKEWFPPHDGRSEDWAILEIVHVKGTGARLKLARAFIKQAKSRSGAAVIASLSVEREPTNPHDPNAIAVLVDLSGRTAIGYVPRDIAANIAAEFPLSMPISARLHKISTLWDRESSEEKFAIWIEVLRPAKRSAWWKANMT